MKNIFKKYTLDLFLSLALILLLFGGAQAQMFSVEEDGPTRDRTLPTNNIYAGVEPVQFEYRGPAGALNAGRYAFDGPLLRVRYETLNFEAFVGLGGRLTGIDEIAYFDVGVKASRGLRIFVRRNFRFEIPLMLKSSLTGVTNDQVITANTQFRQGTVTAAAGGEASVRFGDGIRFSARALPHYGFSFATGGTFGGQIFELETTSRLYFDRLFGAVGLSLGWEYGFKRFDIEQDQFDYNFRSHSFLLGITF